MFLIKQHEKQALPLKLPQNNALKTQQSKFYSGFFTSLIRLNTRNPLFYLVN